MTALAIVVVIQREFGISQPAVSQHLKVLREKAFAHVRAEGPRRIYAVGATPLRQIDEWHGERYRLEAGVRCCGYGSGGVAGAAGVVTSAPAWRASVRSRVFIQEATCA
ncbi:MAG: ArsR/SmtB family transcription factor [Vitreimonas sp.]